MKYCEVISHTKRFKTREVKVGSVGVGGDNPIRIQSMTTSPTHDIPATVDQIIKLADHGCEIVRVTVQGKKEALSCEGIKNSLIQKGYKIPLVADIHFYPPAAMLVADFVDKVRVNPGNFVDKRAIFKTIDYDDASYALEIEKIEETFLPLVEKCKEFKRALRIGTNHGSLSDRIMNRYGDTPAGMVESALEFARVARKADFHDMIFSMKASNPLVMIHAYRLLAAKMLELGWDYPLHLGVTEAGDGEDGRVKSAIGMGSLLLDGLGDTIRVSLTEDPWNEIDPCKRLISLAQEFQHHDFFSFEEAGRDFQAIERRQVALQEPLHRDGSLFLLTKENPSDLGDPEPDDLLSELPEQQIAYGDQPETWSDLIAKNHPWLLFQSKNSLLHEGRRFFSFLKKMGSEIPVILSYTKALSPEDFVIQSSAELGALLADGLGEGILLDARANFNAMRKLGFNILQGVRLRATKTEFIACPSCGRTLFDLQSVTQKIREKTQHLPGVKIAVMGCIVNGPGEMADADFGYVGSGRDKIDLYVGKERVRKGIHHSEAVEHLIQLIKDHDRWVDPISCNK